MASLPFATDLLLPSQPLSGLVRIVLFPDLDEIDDPEAAADHAGAASVVALFAHAVEAQMFTIDPATPARWAALGEPQLAPDGMWELRARVEHLPLAAWAHLLALLRKNHDALEPLRAVMIEAAGLSAKLPLQAALDDVPQHLHDGDPGFTWSAPGVDKSRNLHLDLEFRDSLLPEVRVRVEQDLSVWLQLNILGAFDLAFKEADDLDPIGTIKVTSGHRIECWVPYFTGDISGLVAMQRWLLDLHLRAQPLEEACLE